MTMYAPEHKTLDSGESVYFNGSSSSTGQAQVEQMSGNFNARVYLERSSDGGETYEVVSQFPTGNLKSSWYTTEIDPILKSGTRRIRVDNADNIDGKVEVIGTER